MSRFTRYKKYFFPVIAWVIIYYLLKDLILFGLLLFATLLLAALAHTFSKKYRVHTISDKFNADSYALAIALLIGTYLVYLLPNSLSINQVFLFYLLPTILVYHTTKYYFIECFLGNPKPISSSLKHAIMATLLLIILSYIVNIGVVNLASKQVPVFEKTESLNELANSLSLDENILNALRKVPFFEQQEKNYFESLEQAKKLEKELNKPKQICVINCEEHLPLRKIIDYSYNLYQSFQAIHLMAKTVEVYGDVQQEEITAQKVQEALTELKNKCPEKPREAILFSKLNLNTPESPFFNSLKLLSEKTKLYLLIKKARTLGVPIIISKEDDMNNQYIQYKAIISYLDESTDKNSPLRMTNSYCVYE